MSEYFYFVTISQISSVMDGSKSQINENIETISYLPAV